MLNRLIYYFHTVFVKRALRRYSTLPLYWLSFFFFVLTVMWVINAQNPVLDLEQMDVRTGVVKKINQAWRTECGDTLYLDSDVGEHFKYSGCLTDAQSKKILGERVTIWSQPRFQYFGFTNYLNQIKMGDQLVMNWAEIKPFRMRSHRLYPVEIKVLVFLAILPIAFVWFRNRHDDKF